MVFLAVDSKRKKIFLARSIPNATISWWFNDQEIGRDALDRNFQIKGHGPRSDLIVTPLGMSE